MENTLANELTLGFIADRSLNGFLKKASDVVDDHYWIRNGIQPRMGCTWPRYVAWADVARRGVW